MIISGKLDYARQEKSRRNYLIFTFINGASFTCMADNMLVLYALKCGCPSYFIAIILSFNFWCNIFMLLGKYLISRNGAARTFSIAWLGRNIASLVTASAPFVTMWSPMLGFIVLALGVFGFFATKAAGLAAHPPLIGELTTSSNRGKFTSVISRYSNLACLITMGLIIVIMKFSNSLSTYQLIIFAGAISGFISTFFLISVDETESPRISASKPIKEVIKAAWKTQRSRKLIIANCWCQSALMLVLPASMLALKEGYNLPDYTGLIFTLIQLTGALFLSFFSGAISEESGPRPLVILYYCLSIVISLLWIFSPVEYSMIYTAVIFLVCGAFSFGTYVSLLHYFLAAVNDKERVGTSLFIALVSGAAAGVTGSFLGGGILKYLHTCNLSPLEMYKLYYICVAVFLLCGLFFVCRLEKLEDWAVTKVLGLFFAPRDLQALFFVSRNDEMTTPEEEYDNIEKLEGIGSGLSEKKLLSYLDSPKLVLRIKALQALRQIPFSRKAGSALIYELEHGEFATAHIAAQIVGEREIFEAIPQLRKGLDSKDSYFASRCMISLVQLKQKDSYEKIKSIFKASDNQRMIVHGAAALSEIGDIESLELLLSKSVLNGVDDRARQEIIYNIAEFAELGDAFYKFLKVYRSNKAEAAHFIISFIEGLHDKKLNEAFKGKFSSGSFPKNEIVQALKDNLSSPENEVTKVISNFINKTKAEDLYPELLYCLITIARKYNCFHV